MRQYLLILFLIFQTLNGQVPSFSGPKDLGVVAPNYLDEASGLASSHQNYGIFWTHNDDTNDKRIFAINSEAKIVAIYYIKIDKWHDVEDIAVCKDIVDGNFYIFVGDIGNNKGENRVRRIIKFKEPKVKFNQNLVIDTISKYKIIEFEFKDGNYDSEAFFVDPISNDIIVFSKRLKNEKVYKISYPQKFYRKNILKYITKLPFGFEGFNGSGITAADISFDGKEILVKNYTKVYYFRKNDNQTLEQTFQNDTHSVKYNIEPQGEAITWEPKARGYYTLSEVSPLNIPAHLYFYQKNGTYIKKKTKKKTEITYYHNTLIIHNFNELNSEILVYNLLGNLLYKGTLKNQQLDLDFLPIGIYFIKLIPENEIIKILKD